MTLIVFMFCFYIFIYRYSLDPQGVEGGLANLVGETFNQRPEFFTFKKCMCFYMGKAAVHAAIQSSNLESNQATVKWPNH
jgi:hypothetical protein